jgi:hypothetical protein
MTSNKTGSASDECFPVFHRIAVSISGVKTRVAGTKIIIKSLICCYLRRGDAECGILPQSEDDEVSENRNIGLCEPNS